MKNLLVVKAEGDAGGEKALICLALSLHSDCTHQKDPPRGLKPIAFFKICFAFCTGLGVGSRVGTGSVPLFVISNLSSTSVWFATSLSVTSMLSFAHSTDFS